MLLTIVVGLAYNHLNSSPRKTLDVGSFEPNQFGLYDMLGNVWEWTSDCLEKDRGKCIVAAARGGSWDNFANNVRAARRLKFPSDHRANSIGFRVVVTLMENECQGMPRQKCDNPNQNEQTECFCSCHDKTECPEMVILDRLDGKQILIGSPEGEKDRDDDEKGRQVTFYDLANGRYDHIAMGRYEVTFNEWNTCRSDPINLRNEKKVGHFADK